jgi:hypothetical protein
MLRRILSVVVILVFALGTVVLADPPTLTIQQQATLDPSNFAVSVTVAVNCGPSAPMEFELEVAVRQGDLAGTSGGNFFTATGDRQMVSVDVFGVFDPGDASASATLICGPLTEGITLGTQIKISQ